ncbi:DUF499 domain-containing protein [Anaerocellum diazotrophicum]|uniref:DUF499 domain-containing protein n=1 Tax=Caldicellulosiruptor diazotrophicus TaxID=2806205 RepID=A0ABM7NLH3_9FIRM|nr:DUF499 domain-containing protein [Caldicellulosiruptor diazotrophicus]BCS80966.1 hypothetical protein CaldiYA01_09260 [Caldicellulosiruptor diazotrophicus]
MKTLFELCKPREDVFATRSSEDVQEISDLLSDKINPEKFFDQTYITNGMRRLFDVAFRRFKGLDESQGLIVLRQAMGGGKTHNMIALGLLAKYPELRKKVLGENYPYFYEGRVRTAIFTGRWTNSIPWVEIAKQLGKQEILNNILSNHMHAPGDREWTDLLSGDPLLILLDELPLYLDYARSIPVGESNFGKVVSIGLSNLFNSIQKKELSNVMIVVSDLQAAYEQGGQLLRSALAFELDKEATRVAFSIQPVDMVTNDIYCILRKRFFVEYPQDPENDADVDQIARAYKEEISEGNKKGQTTVEPERIYTEIKRTYPFHPAIMDLVSRFRENVNFQQTRGLIRLMRHYMKYLYKDEGRLAKERYLIEPCDFDLSDYSTREEIINIKQSLENAIMHDVYSTAYITTAKSIDQKYNTDLASKVAKLILLSSLSEITKSPLGLTSGEIYAYLLSPGRALSIFSNVLEDFKQNSLHARIDSSDRIYLAPVENVVARMRKFKSMHTLDEAEERLERYLRSFFEPRNFNCYQKVYQKVIALPNDISKIPVDMNNVTLVISKPYNNRGDLNPALKDFWANQTYKNRLLFLTGSTNMYDSLLEKIREYICWEDVLEELKRDGIPATDSEYKRAENELTKSANSILETIRETFNKLYYPQRLPLKHEAELISVDVKIEVQNENNQEKKTSGLLGNNRDGERIIQEVLRGKKYIEPADINEFREKVESILFTQERMSWSEVVERAARDARWFWHPPQALEDLKRDMISKGLWKEDSGYVLRGEAAKEKSTVMVRVLYPDFDTGELVLKLTPMYGDTVYYEEGDQIPTENSQTVQNKNEFRTKSVKINFLCVDSSGFYPKGDIVKFESPIYLDDNIRFTDNEGKMHIKVRTVPRAKVLYTTDGSSPRYNGIEAQNGDITIPDNCKLIIIIAEKDGVYSEQKTIKIGSNTRPGVAEQSLDYEKPVRLKLSSNKKIIIYSIEDLNREASLLKEYGGRFVSYNLEIYKDDDNYVVIHSRKQQGEEVEEVFSNIEKVKTNFYPENIQNIRGVISEVLFDDAKKFEEWLKQKGRSLQEFREAIIQDE